MELADMGNECDLCITLHVISMYESFDQEDAEDDLIELCGFFFYAGRYIFALFIEGCTTISIYFSPCLHVSCCTCIYGGFLFNDLWFDLRRQEEMVTIAKCFFE